MLEIFWIALGRPDVLGMYKRARGMEGKALMMEDKKDLVADAKRNTVSVN
jgi:hypothetical protein